MFSLRLVLVVVAGALSASVKEEPSCPDPVTISPCLCTIESEGLYLDCSAVVSESELEASLQADFPSNDFYLFGIYNNNNLKVIHNGIFGDLTFQVIEIKVGYVEVIEAGAFLGSASTLQQINLFNNELRSFPFEQIEMYEQLWDLEMTYNEISPFPNIKSDSLMTLDMSKNPLNTISADALQQLPNLMDAIFESCEFSEVFSGTFTGLPNLNYVTLFSNNLTFIPTNLMELHGDGSYAYLGINRIEAIELGAFSGVSRVFDMDNNLLTTLDEDLWRPMLEAGAGIYFVGNPLDCGNDILWLIEEPEFMKLLDPYAACANGTLLSDLIQPLSP